MKYLALRQMLSHFWQARLERENLFERRCHLAFSFVCAGCFNELQYEHVGKF